MEKMRYTKKFGSLALVSLLATSVLAACGDGKEEGGSSSDTDTIKIGANLELSGNVAIYGSSVLDGAELAIEEINANGGIQRIGQIHTAAYSKRYHRGGQRMRPL